jgi:hypothetical protein
MVQEVLAFFSAFGQWMGNHLAPIATFTAALVALFKEDIVKRWRRPKLTHPSAPSEIARQRYRSDCGDEARVWEPRGEQVGRRCLLFSVVD